MNNNTTQPRVCWQKGHDIQLLVHWIHLEACNSSSNTCFNYVRVSDMNFIYYSNLSCNFKIHVMIVTKVLC